MSLAEFLVKLATDPAALEAFTLDPDAYMAELGLTEAQRSVINSGRLGDIRYAVEAELEVEGETMYISFRPPVWFLPVWFVKGDSEDDEESST
jgi:hypothetical protein